MAQRLRDEVKGWRRRPRREQNAGAELTVKESHIHEQLALRGVDASVGMVRSMIAGASVACGDFVMTIQNGKLVSRNKATLGLDKLPSQIMAAKQQAADTVGRMKTVFLRNKRGNV